MLEDIQRHEFDPRTDVYISDDGVHMEEAPQSLADDVMNSLKEQRERLLDAFGTYEVPGLDLDGAHLVRNYYKDIGATVARHVIIDPSTDLPKLREILESGYLAKPYIDFFAGDEEGYSSPGGSEAHDLIILRDWRDKYRDEVRRFVDSCDGFEMSDDELDSVVRRKVIDLVGHEEGHTIKGVHADGIVLERDKDGRLYISGKETYDFEPLKSEVEPPEYTELSREGDYYNGPIIPDEGMAASHSVEILTRDGQLQFEDGWPYITGTMSYEDCRSAGAIIGIHSSSAYRSLQKTYQAFPEMRQIVESYEAGGMTTRDYLLATKGVLPPELWNLAAVPGSDAWSAFEERINGIIASKQQ